MKLFFLVQIVCACIISLFYGQSLQINALQAIYFFLSFIAQIHILFFPFFLILYFLPSKVKAIFLPITFTILLSLLFVDTRIFAFFRFHINPLVWNVLSTPGGWETLGIQNKELFYYFLGFSAFLISEFFLYNWCIDKKKELHFSKKKWTTIVGSLFIIGSIIYSLGDLFSIPKITQVAQVVPYYQPLTIKRSFNKIFGFLPAPSANINLRKDGNLNYPKKEIELQKKKELPNIILLVIDCFRDLSFNQEYTPNIFSFSKKSQVFRNHYSGGNSTRPGVFSILYSIAPFYWNYFLNEQRSPVFLDTLSKLNYKMGIFSSTSLNFPEFRKTAFMQVNNIHDKYTGKTQYEKDTQVIHDLKQFISQNKEEHFFTYTLLDGSHSAYSFPSKEIKYKPIVQDFTYSSLTKKQKRIHMKNRYLNALRYVDKQLKSFFEHLKNEGVLKNTIVFVTGDHGDEFMEFGNIGHSNAFTDPQIKSPLIMYLPNTPPKTHTYPTTHYDIVPTLMEKLGVVNPITDYSQGENLFDSKSKRDIISCGWDTCSLIDDKGYMIFGTKTYNTHHMEFRNLKYQSISSKEGLTDNRKKSITNILYKMKEFLE